MRSWKAEGEHRLGSAFIPRVDSKGFNEKLGGARARLVPSIRRPAPMSERGFNKSFNNGMHNEWLTTGF